MNEQGAFNRGRYWGLHNVICHLSAMGLFLNACRWYTYQMLGEESKLLDLPHINLICS